MMGSSAVPLIRAGKVGGGMGYLCGFFSVFLVTSFSVVTFAFFSFFFSLDD